MKKAIAVVVAALCVSGAFAGNVPMNDVQKSLANLSLMQDIAFAIEFQRQMTGNVRVTDVADPWGTPYRIEQVGSSYRIVSAGSDKTFDEASWAVEKQFSGTEGDAVLEDGMMVRSNRNWLAQQVPADDPSLKKLREREVQFMVMRTPSMMTMMSVQTTMRAMETLASHIEQYRATHSNSLAALASAGDPLEPLGINSAHDGWSTPFRIVIEGDRYRIISAGSDKTFKPETWSTPASADASEDVIYENGAFRRQLDVERMVKSAAADRVTPIPQPPDVDLGETGKYVRVGGEVVAPVVKNRVNPIYPENMRRMGIGGIVIAQVALSETGAVQDVHILKSLTPELDLAAANAVRQWTFSPATKNGRPVPAAFSVTLNFALK